MKATLDIDYEQGLDEFFTAEKKTFPRGSYAVEKEGGLLRFTLTAEDATAMRTVFSSIIKQLIIWEKTP